MTTPTPETDASLLRYTGGELVTFPSGINPVVDADFARKLERERDSYRNDLQLASSRVVTAEIERDEALLQLAAYQVNPDRITQTEIAMARTANSQLASVMRERDEARKEADRQTEIANSMTNYMGDQAQLILERDQLRKENETLRNAQKACEHCDGPTLEETKQLRNENDELKLKLAYLEADNQEHIQRDMQRTGELDQLRKERDEARQQIHDWIVSDKRTAELNQLRKVADELAAAAQDAIYMTKESDGIVGWHLNGDILRWEQVEFIALIYSALVSYRELPHVKKS